ncbi:DUF4123 domain-containing protein [Pantoea sp. GD03673]|uniref:DUF4123 domain-containing protein n=1 Tax=Pantoea sp. GD03673 TaxID=2975364 RepID=UPI0024487E00|nr:DUF4123 domain-containing protein [Pantoea sp. GD03673]MDH2067452.1 DUF4123 domain-containing protein [Pantoea sp. GD03673]
MTEYDYSDGARQNNAKQLHTAIAKAVKDRGESLYLLVDPASLPADIDIPHVQALVAEHPVPVILLHESLTRDSDPWLINIEMDKPQHVPLLEISIGFALNELHTDHLGQGNGRAVCGWLLSPFDAETVARQLGNTAIQSLSDHSQILLRYYDPIVHSVLWSHFSALQHQRWLGVLSHWLYPDGDGQIITREHTPVSSPFLSFSLALSPEDEAMFDATGKVNRTLERHRSLHINHHRHGEVEAVVIVSQALERASSQHGFNYERDQQLLALDCLHWHPQFNTHPDVRILLSRRERDLRASYTDCLASLNKARYPQLCNELNERNQ